MCHVMPPFKLLITQPAFCSLPAQSDDGTASDKLDFTVSLPCSAFICPILCSQYVPIINDSICDKSRVEVKHYSISTTLFLSKCCTIKGGAHMHSVDSWTPDKSM